MGLIDFVKSAGEMIFGGSDEPEAVGQSPEEVKQAAEAAMASALTQQVNSHGLQCDNLQISFSDEVATVTGTAASQSEREKIVLVVGNVNGVAQVNDMLEYHNALLHQLVAFLQILLLYIPLHLSNMQHLIQQDLHQLQQL